MGATVRRDPGDSRRAQGPAPAPAREINPPAAKTLHAMSLRPPIRIGLPTGASQAASSRRTSP